MSRTRKIPQPRVNRTELEISDSKEVICGYCFPEPRCAFPEFPEQKVDLTDVEVYFGIGAEEVRLFVVDSEGEIKVVVVEVDFCEDLHVELYTVGFETGSVCEGRGLGIGTEVRLQGVECHSVDNETR